MMSNYSLDKASETANFMMSNYSLDEASKTANQNPNAIPESK